MTIEIREPGARAFTRTTRRVLLAIFVLWLLPTRSLFAQSSENVAVVINEASADAQRIGEHYIKVRAIPAENVIRIRTETAETIERPAYARTIEQPIATAITKGNLTDRVLYIVLTKGIPLRIAGTAGTDGSVSSVDSELTLLYRRMTGQVVTTRGRIDNPYFLGERPVADARRFTHRDFDIFLVSRLDAFTVDEALALIDRAQSPAHEGKVVLDERASLLSRGGGIGDQWLAEAAKRLTATGQGAQVLLEDTSRPARDVDGVLGYYSWGSNDESNRVRRFGMKFVPGALAATFVSSDGRTFENPPDAWMPLSNWDDKRTWFGGSPQSLIGDLIRDGATGVAGHVAEPYLQSTVRPEILFPAYVAGFNLVEAFYLALPHLSWQAIVVGDPLCVAFPRKVLSRADIEDAVDASTELPGLFSKRRLDVAMSSAKTVPAKAMTLAVLAEARDVRGDKPGTKKALEEAAALAPNLILAQVQLAMLEQESGNFDGAAERYRAILKQQPNQPVVLNNLAYMLAVNQSQPAEGIQFARRAATLVPDNPSFLDTVGWIEHLLGNNDAAARFLSQAVKLDPTIAESRLHAAIVYAELGALANAHSELKEAIRLNPEFEKQTDVITLQKRLAGTKN